MKGFSFSCRDDACEGWEIDWELEKEDISILVNERNDYLARQVLNADKIATRLAERDTKDFKSWANSNTVSDHFSEEKKAQLIAERRFELENVELYKERRHSFYMSELFKKYIRAL